jgi:hypothetical protein
MLSSTAFDGFRETRLWLTWYHVLFSHFIFLGDAASTIIPTIFLFLSPFFFLFCFAFALLGMRSLTHCKLRIWELFQMFVFTLVPIALAYNIAHYFTLFLVGGQVIIPLMSDPFHRGVDIFHTASFIPNIGIVGMSTVWYTQLLVIVSGHIVSIYLAHHVAVRMFQRARDVVMSQIPMLLLMVLYTLLGLWVLSLPLGI